MTGDKTTINSVKKLERICRTCLSKKHKMRSIFKDSLHELLMSCASVPVSKNDGLSNLICIKCMDLIKKFYDFKEQCKKSDKILREKYNLCNETNEPDEIKPEVKLETEGNEILNENSEVVDFSYLLKTEIDESDEDVTYDSSPFENSVLQENNLVKKDNISIRKDAETKEQKIRKAKQDKHYNESNDSDCIQEEDNLNSTGSECEEENETESTKKHLCNICNLEVRFAGILQRHKETHCEVNPRTYVCHICHDAFHDKRNLQKHMARHEGKRRYKCQQCNRTYKSIEPLIGHIKAKHKDFKKLECSSCDRTFILQSQLDRHVSVVHKEPQHLVCAQCGMSFKSRCFLKTHELRHEMGDRPFACTQCNKRFATKYTLKYHQRFHDGESSSSTLCPICGKGVSVLTRHLRVHSDERPFFCDECSKRFKSKVELKVHKERHAGIRRYACHICEMRFGESQTLKNHLLIHTGEKPHECTVCGKTFRQRSVLRTHMKVHELF